MLKYRDLHDVDYHKRKPYENLFPAQRKILAKRNKNQSLRTNKFNLITHENSDRRLIESDEALEKTKEFWIISLEYYYILSSEVQKIAARNTLVSLLLLSMMFYLNRDINITSLG